MQINNDEKKLQIFISSTFLDMKEERQVAVQAILKMGHIPAGMELFAAGNKSQLTTIEQWIAESDIYMLILGSRYGAIENESGLSYTECEYNYAVNIGKPIFAVVLSDAILEKKRKSVLDNDEVEKQNNDKYRQFRMKVKAKMSSFFETPSEISEAIMHAITHLKKEHDCKGWVQYENLEACFSKLRDVETLQRLIDLISNEKRALAIRSEKLMIGINILRRDKLSSHEIVSLHSMVFGMSKMFDFEEADAWEIIKTGIHIACADDDFRPREQQCILDLSERFGIDKSQIQNQIDLAIVDIEQRKSFGN